MLKKSIIYFLIGLIVTKPFFNCNYQELFEKAIKASYRASYNRRLIKDQTKVISNSLIALSSSE
jgi:hypothetical protein